MGKMKTNNAKFAWSKWARVSKDFGEDLKTIITESRSEHASQPLNEVIKSCMCHILNIDLFLLIQSQNVRNLYLKGTNKVTYQTNRGM